MNRSQWLSVGMVLVIMAGEANGQERFVPSTVSKEAAKLIRELEPDHLPAAIKEEWQATWKATEESFRALNARALEEYPAEIERRSIAEMEHLLLIPSSYDPVNAGRILVYVHGGAHTVSSPESTLMSSLAAAHFTRTKVLAVRYPLAWQKPHPASRDVIVAVYQTLLEDHLPRQIAMYGDSAGGAALMSAVLRIRDQGLPMPAALGLLSPWADVTNAGDSQALLQDADVTLDYEGNLKASAELYAAGKDLRDPSVSPLYADFRKGFPPAYISTGTRDMFLSHCARLQRKLIDAGIENELVVHEGMWHVFQVYPVPEARDAWRDMAAFLERHWAR
ncbi:MAG: alpha/beta hydrolase [Gammaproteobacteria bacterium]|nr:alpha/beta hydrolase [Gammaproteobacteria bacterium]NNJ95872.1 alpha/beta hydrolase [Gammaproteobacteria bacterium]